MRGAFRGFLLPGPAAAALLALCAGAQARTFDVKAISETNNFNRAPVISDTGAVAWLSVHPNPDREGFSDLDVMFWKDGQLTNLREKGASGSCSQPAVSGDEVVFIGQMRRNGAIRDEEEQKADGLPLAAPEVMLTDSQREMEKEAPNLFLNTHANYRRNPVDAGGEGEEAPSGERKATASPGWDGNDVFRYDSADGTVKALTASDHMPSFPKNGAAGATWQSARMWPYGYNIVFWDRERNEVKAVCANFYYMLAPALQGEQLVFQGWDGHDYEIYIYDVREGVLTQITDNQFDDVMPSLWNHEVAWVAYPSLSGEIFHWNNGEIRKISTDSKENLNPQIWEGKVVWQGFDGEDSELYYFDGVRTIKLTSNTWDDVQPKFRDGLIAWMSYVGGWDAEIMAMDIEDKAAVALSENETEDRDPDTAGGKVVWQANGRGRSVIYLAE